MEVFSFQKTIYVRILQENICNQTNFHWKSYLNCCPLCSFLFIVHPFNFLNKYYSCKMTGNNINAFYPGTTRTQPQAEASNEYYDQ